MWIDNINELFSIDMYPLKHDSISVLCNKLTRMLLVVVLIMLFFNYSFTKIGIVLGVGLIGIVVIYLITNKKEKFSQVDSKMDGYTAVSELTDLSSNTISSVNSFHVSSVTSQVSPVISGAVQFSPVTTQVSHITSGTAQVSPITSSAVQVSPITSSAVQVSPITSSNVQVSPITSGTVQVSSIDTHAAVFSPTGNLTTSIRSLFETPHRERTDLSQLEKRSRAILHTPVPGYTHYSTAQPRKQHEFYTPYVGTNTHMYQKQVIVAPRLMDADFSSVHTNSQVDENPLQDFGGMAMPTHIPRRTRMLLPRETRDDVESEPLPHDRVFRRNVQPHVYSMTNERIPINASLGISSTPQLPEVTKHRFRGEDGRTYPVFSRIDPQLVRDDVPDERKEELPRRNEWSEDLPQPAQDNPMYSVYDPRFTGYGDQNRSYFDTHLGQIKYYYGDVDAYRSPNFVIRNKVDHVDMIDPMGKVHSHYPRTASLEDVSDQVNDDWLARSTEFREDIMEKLMRKNNSESWQLRKAPMSKGARLSTFTSSY